MRRSISCRASTAFEAFSSGATCKGNARSTLVLRLSHWRNAAQVFQDCPVSVLLPRGSDAASRQAVDVQQAPIFDHRFV